MSGDLFCRGCYGFGTACGDCSRCTEERAQLVKDGLIAEPSHEAAVTYWREWHRVNDVKRRGPSTFDEVVDAEMRELLRHGLLNETLVRASLLKMATMDVDLDGVGDWIQTYTGRAFWPLAPRAEDIVIEDIAHALSCICRFNGHTTSFYSAAQHSILVSRACDRHGPLAALRGLLHDGSEAYLLDVPKPLKRSSLFKPYLRYEKRLQAMIYDVFGLDKDDPPYIKEADLAVLATEKRDLMVPMLGQHEWEKMPEPFDEKILPANSAWAERVFMVRFDHLMGLV